VLDITGPPIISGFGFGLGPTPPRAQAIVDVEDAEGPPGLVDDEEAGDRLGIHLPHRFGGQRLRPDRLRRRRHHVVDALGEKGASHVAAEIAVGDDADKLAMAVHHAGAAEALAVITRIASDIALPAATSGTASPACMTSATRSSCRPSWPPGCSA